MTSGVGITYAISIIIVIGVAYYIYKIAQAEADKIMAERRTSVFSKRSKSKMTRLSDIE